MIKISRYTLRSSPTHGYGAPSLQSSPLLLLPHPPPPQPIPQPCHPPHRPDKGRPRAPTTSGHQSRPTDSQATAPTPRHCPIRNHARHPALKRIPGPRGSSPPYPSLHTNVSVCSSPLPCYPGEAMKISARHPSSFSHPFIPSLSSGPLWMMLDL